MNKLDILNGVIQNLEVNGASFSGNLIIDGNIGIATTTPNGRLHTVQTGNNISILSDMYSNGAILPILQRRARGTEASPLGVLNNDAILAVGGRGHTGTDFVTSTRVSIVGRADEDWTTTTTGTRIDFIVTTNGTTSVTTPMTIKNNGNVGINTSTPTEKLEVNGNIKANRLIGVSDIQRSIIKQNTDIAHTGTTTNTLIASYLIPAGTFDVNDIFRFRASFSQTNNANVKTARMYINSSASLTGATLIGTRILTSSAGSSIVRDMVFKNNLSSQQIVNPATNLMDDEATNNNGLSTLSLDFSVDQYIIVAVQLAEVTDTVTLNWLRSQILR